MQYTLNTLQEEIRAKLERKSDSFVLKHKKKAIQIDKEPNDTIVDALGLSENGSSEVLELILEYAVGSPTTTSNGWTLYVKTLTGRIIDVETMNPQVHVCIHVHVLYMYMQ